MHALEDSFFIDYSVIEDESKVEYHLALESENRTTLHEIDVKFELRYSVVQDMKRWLPKGVLACSTLFTFSAYPNC